MTSADEVESGAPRKIEGKLQAMVVCFILGLGSLVSWNSMLTIGDYYYKLFPKYHPARVLTLVYQPFALGTMAILACYESKINTRMRNLAGYILFFASTFFVLVLDLATSGKGGIGHYIGLCALSACFGLADAHVQGGMVGDLSFMCPEFIQSFLAGLAASGALISVLRMLTKVAFENSHNGLRKGAILFFAISTFIEFLCIILYAFYFPKLPIVNFYRSKAASEGSKTVSADLAAAGIQAADTNEQDGYECGSKQERLNNKQLFLQNLDYAVDLFLIYVVTLSIFPGFLYENTGAHQLGSWYPLVLISTYNVVDLVSRYIPLVRWLKLESRKGLVFAVVCRFLLIPAFYMTAKYGEQGWMILLTAFLGLTNGYLTVCVLTVAPKGYKGPEQNALGNLLVLCLLGGIFAGVALDWLWLIGVMNIIKWEQRAVTIPIALRREKAGSVCEVIIRYLHKQKEAIPVEWKKPGIGWTKLNFDGSCKWPSGEASIGGLVRDHRAQFLLGYAEPIGPANSTMAELAALRRGLELVVEHGWREQVWVEGDAKTLVEIIEERREVRCMEVEREMSHIKSVILPELQNLVVTHIYREGNRAADKFARLGHRLDKPTIWTHVPPPQVLPIVHQDAQGKIVLRRRRLSR